jgi:hypothetical protein
VGFYTKLRLILTVVIGAGAITGEWYAAATEQHDEVGCKPVGSLTALPGLPEASGVVASRRTGGVLWTLNDSGDPQLVAVGTDGSLKGRVRITGANVQDWEALSPAQCNGRACLYIGDIGDNNASRKSITVYRVPEPAVGDKETAPVETFTATYPDGPHDAEALFVGRDGELMIVTKEKPSAVYRFPSPLRAGTTVTLEAAGMLPIQSVTDAATSRDGEWIAVRTNGELFFFRHEEFTLGAHGTPVKLEKVGEPQGEGVAVGENGRLYLVGEGGKNHQPGTLATLECSYPGAPKK